MKKNVLRTALLGAGLTLSLLVQAASYDRLVVFGDSLSDVGNNALLFGSDAAQQITGDGYFAQRSYASGTYTNGQVWAQRFAAQLGLAALPSLGGGDIFAYGGAETGTDGAGGYPISLSTQLGQYLTREAGMADPNALYVVAGGGNNARVALEEMLMGADANSTIGATAMAYAADIGAIVDRLQAAGAQHILVWNSPDFGMTPLANSYGPQASFASTSLSLAMNGALDQRLAGETVMRFDVFGFMHGAVANAGALGFSDVLHACGALSNACADPASALYFDGIHPTDMAHQILANGMLAVAVPEPASDALMSLGLLVCAMAVRRRRAARQLAS